MPTLLACLSTGKGTWNEVLKVIHAQPWEKVFLITNNFGKENFIPLPKTELIVIDSFQDTTLMVDQIKKSLKDKIKDLEIALNLASGAGKEHMALLEAVLEMGLNFRIVIIDNKGQMEVLGLKR